MSKWSSTAIEVCEYYYLSAPNGEKNEKNGINFAVESILPCTGINEEVDVSVWPFWAHREKNSATFFSCSRHFSEHRFTRYGLGKIDFS